MDPEMFAVNNPFFKAFLGKDGILHVWSEGGSDNALSGVKKIRMINGAEAAVLFKSGVLEVVRSPVREMPVSRVVLRHEIDDIAVVNGRIHFRKQDSDEYEQLFTGGFGRESVKQQDDLIPGSKEKKAMEFVEKVAELYEEIYGKKPGKKKNRRKNKKVKENESDSDRK
ncbi:MAG: hypothetical protein IJJ67_00320 [Oscillospiraceae bacterium]|nr:hypothetical protein [Oscillospiraceae bacterium]